MYTGFMWFMRVSIGELLLIWLHKTEMTHLPLWKHHILPLKNLYSSEYIVSMSKSKI
jgi:hypothetical protein